jgi:rhomboid protease GluP
VTSASKRDLPTVAITLAVLNVAMFVWQLATGADPMSPTGEWMKDHGGNYGPVTLAGEPWRLATSMFLHYGFLHLLMNMIGLLDGGRAVEKKYGSAGFLALYVVAGLAGSLASALRGQAVSAGASGAIFGIFGAFGAFLLLHRKRLDAATVGREARGLLIFLAFNVYIGLSVQGIDHFAHVGGLVAGFVCGLALELGTNDAPSTLKRAVIVGVVGVGLVVGGAFVIGAPPDRIAETNSYNSLVTTENAVSRQWQDLARKVGAGEVTDAAFADALEKDILPPWREAIAKFQRDGSGDRYEKMLAYLRKREEAWVMLVKAARENNAVLASQATTKLKEADDLIQAINATLNK